MPKPRHRPRLARFSFLSPRVSCRELPFAGLNRSRYFRMRTRSEYEYVARVPRREIPRPRGRALV
eukprot:31039-Pelagococcus_subviridis.AAC.6